MVSYSDFLVVAIYQGCFRTADYSLSWGGVLNPNSDIACATLCWTSGLKVAAPKYGNECFCSNNVSWSYLSLSRVIHLAVLRHNTILLTKFDKKSTAQNATQKETVTLGLIFMTNYWVDPKKTLDGILK